MKTLRLHKPFDLRFHDEPVPDIGPDEVLVKVGSVGVCASDVHYYAEGRIGDQVVKEPLILGHEFSGVVARVGDNVKNLSEGMRVAVEPGDYCKQCAACRSGMVNLCPNVRFFGTPPIDGSLREYLAWPAELCLPVPDSISLDEAAMLEPLGVGVWSVDLAEIKGGETVAVLGAGAIGLSVMQAARAAGAARILVTDLIPERRELARKLGADLVLDPQQPDTNDRIMQDTEGGADVVFECAGMPDTTYQTTHIVRLEGRIVIVGIPEDDQYLFNASLSRKREVTVRFVRRSRNTGERSLQLVKKGLVDVSSYATHRFPFDRAEDAIKLAMDKTDGVLRAVVQIYAE